jgi:hypothetical protein
MYPCRTIRRYGYSSAVDCTAQGVAHKYFLGYGRSMANTKTDLERIRAHIRRLGPTEVASRTKLARRTLQYLLQGQSPTYKTFSTLMQDMQR